MTNIRRTAIAGLAAIAFVAAGSLANTTEAHAGGKHVAGALLGGIVVGALIGAATQPVYAQPSYGVTYAQPVYQPRCWKENQFAGYNGYGQPVYQRVRVCG
jgi:hypothetical protein